MTIKEEVVRTNDNMHHCFNEIRIEDANDANLSMKLEDCNAQYCTSIDLIKKKFDQTERQMIKHYVAMTIAGHYSGVGCIGSSYKVISEAAYNENLVNKLEEKLGANLGDKSKYEPDYKVGKCAEVRVADNLLKFETVIDDFTKITFTHATRPRTQEQYKSGICEEKDYYRARCKNCTVFFGDEKTKN